MDHNPKAYLFDIKQACDEIANFTERITYQEYSANPMIKAAVERKFLMIGEALMRLKRENLEILKAITDYEKVIGFRNVLVHGYVWSAVKDSMPTLRREVEELLST